MPDRNTVKRFLYFFQRNQWADFSQSRIDLYYIDYGGSWSFFTRFLAKIFYLIQFLLTTHPIESLDSLNRAQISG
jgi:hypothetical protein